MALGIGIQLGPTALRAVVLERSNARLKLVAAHETLCDTSNAQALTRALTDLRTRLDELEGQLRKGRLGVVR